MILYLMFMFCATGCSDDEGVTTGLSPAKYQNIIRYKVWLPVFGWIVHCVMSQMHTCQNYQYAIYNTNIYYTIPITNTNMQCSKVQWKVNWLMYKEMLPWYIQW